MKTTVVCGLLGSGKTTFIRSFLSGRTEKAVVLVNDFGQAGIDGEVLTEGGIESIELPSGCVCCTLKVDLITSIRKIVTQFAPEHLLIEPSGVASPAGVLEALESAGVEQAVVIGVVDAVEFAELYGSGMYGNFFREQIESSDTVLLNKADIASEEQMIAAKTMIADINPRAVVFRTVNAEMNETIFPRPGRPGKNRTRSATLMPLRRSGHCSFETRSFRLRPAVRLAAVRILFNGLAQGKYGAVARAKALVATDEGPYRFDLVFGKIDVARFDRAVTDSRLVVIGEGLLPDDLLRSIPDGLSF